jgi:signal transduction histidine kinase
LPDVIASIFKTISLLDNIRLSIDVKVHDKIETEATFIRRSLTNLVNNAIQAMPDGGNLTVSASQCTDKILLTVEDTGVGIPEEVKPKLFSPMTTTKAKGQGLGLAVVKRLIEALNGSVSFESQEGKGTKFIVELPLKPPKPNTSF